VGCDPIEECLGLCLYKFSFDLSFVSNAASHILHQCGDPMNSFSTCAKEDCWRCLTIVIPLGGRLYIGFDSHNILSCLQFVGVAVATRNLSRIVHSVHCKFPKKHFLVLVGGFSM